jgi:hypothetical protein
VTDGGFHGGDLIDGGLETVAVSVSQSIWETLLGNRQKRLGNPSRPRHDANALVSRCLVRQFYTMWLTPNFAAQRMRASTNSSLHAAVSNP